MDLFLKALLFNCVCENSHLPKSKQSTALSTLGWGWWGDNWQNLLLSCLRGTRGPPKSPAHLPSPVAPIPGFVASPCPLLLRPGSAQFRPSSHKSAGYSAELGTRGSGHGFLLGSAWRCWSSPHTSHTQEQFCGTWH